jgi:type IV secretory pathway TrbD component
MVVTLLSGPGGLMTANFVNIGIAAALFFLGRGILSHTAKSDAQMSDVFRGSVKYRGEYPAQSTAALRKGPKARRWA